MNMCAKTSAITTAILLTAIVFGATAIAATGATKDEAVAMVKKAVSAIKSDGPDSLCRDQ